MTDHLPSSDEFGEQCKEVIVLGNFRTATLDDLDPWTRTLAQSYLGGLGIAWQVAELPVGCILKIKDAFLKYLIVMPMGSYEGQTRDQFCWLIGTDPNKDQHTISPDDALVYLLRRRLANKEAMRWSNQN